MNKAIISVGSNLEPSKYITAAKNLLANRKALLDESRFIQTRPRGFKNQPDFLNGAFYIRTELDMKCLKSYLKSIENKLGRIRTSNKNGPRTIDLDIVVFNNKIVDEDYFKYDFVKKAVDEIRSRQSS